VRRRGESGPANRGSVIRQAASLRRFGAGSCNARNTRFKYVIQILTRHFRDLNSKNRKNKNEAPRAKIENNYLTDLSGVALAKPETEVMGMEVRERILRRRSGFCVKALARKIPIRIRLWRIEAGTPPPPLPPGGMPGFRKTTINRRYNSALSPPDILPLPRRCSRAPRGALSQARERRESAIT
jgi:hypothetical protein